MLSVVLTPDLLLQAYCQGIFPMADPDKTNALYWYDPDPRAIIPLESFHIPKRLRRTLRQNGFEIGYNSNFNSVILACAEPAPGRQETWLSPELIQLYSKLNQLGYAYSCESYREGELVGGVYGVAIGGFFAGESMFSRVTDASKVALVCLLQHLRQQGFSLFDTQFITPHLRQFGATCVSRTEYRRRLASALSLKVNFIPDEKY